MTMTTYITTTVTTPTTTMVASDGIGGTERQRSAVSYKNLVALLAICVATLGSCLRSNQLLAGRTPLEVNHEVANTTATQHHRDGRDRNGSTTSTMATTLSSMNGSSRSDMEQSAAYPAMQQTQPWSDVIANSSEYFWGNELNLTFVTTLALDIQLARLSVKVSLDDPQQVCPFPSMRGRLSGAAIVDIPIENPAYKMDGTASRTDPSVIQMDGSVWIPVPGVYFLEIVLLHCTMDAFDASRTSMDLRKRCPVRPSIHRDVRDYKFVVRPFQRSQAAIDRWIADTITTPPAMFPYSAWVFAPECLRSAEANTEPCAEPRIVRTKFQQLDYLQFFGIYPRLQNFRRPVISNRFSNYAFLPVNRSDGSFYYDTKHDERVSIPPVPGVTQQDYDEGRLCYVGDSFARYLHFEAAEIITNQTHNSDACGNVKRHVSHEQSLTVEKGRFRVNFADELAYVPQKELFRNCSVVFFFYGRHDAGHSRTYPTTAVKYAESVRLVLKALEEWTLPTTNTYALSVAPTSLGKRALTCIDWRVHALIDAYNDALWKETNTLPNGLRQFQNLSRSFLLDNSDMELPLYDSAHDWSHPCRHVFRPMDKRLLQLAARELAATPRQVADHSDGAGMNHDTAQR